MDLKKTEKRLRKLWLVSLESSFFVFLVPPCVVMFVAVSPIPLGCVRPFIILSYRYRLSLSLSKYRTFVGSILFFKSNDISKVSVRYPTLLQWVILIRGTCTRYNIFDTWYQVGSKAQNKTRKWYSRIRFTCSIPGRY